MQQIVLASTSPRRREILELLELDFDVVDSLYDEDKIQTDDPVELVEELALQKALAVAERYPDSVIIGGDTTVTFGSGWLAKASSSAEAKVMFGSLLGKTHQVVTGVAVVNSLTGEQYVGHEIGSVSLRNATEEELEAYAANPRNWQGFAGAYALQGAAAPFVLNQSGKLSAIIGLPVELTVDLLEQAGIMVEVDPTVIEERLHDLRVGLSS